MLNWNSLRIDDAISEAHNLAKDAADVLAVLKANAAQTRTLLAAWATPDPFTRKEGKVMPCLAVPGHGHATCDHLESQVIS